MIHFDFTVSDEEGQLIFDAITALRLRGIERINGLDWEPVVKECNDKEKLWWEGHVELINKLIKKIETTNIEAAKRNTRSRKKKTTEEVSGIEVKHIEQLGAFSEEKKSWVQTEEERKRADISPDKIYLVRYLGVWLLGKFVMHDYSWLFQPNMGTMSIFIGNLEKLYEVYGVII